MLRVVALVCSAFLVSSCALWGSIERVPGPEDPALAARAHGTVMKVSGRSVELVDLPSLNRLEVRMTEGARNVFGVDEEGRVGYLLSLPGGPFSLRVFRALTKEHEEIVSLEMPSHWGLSLAPAGGTVVAWRIPRRNDLRESGAVDTQLELVDVDEKRRRTIDVDVGHVVGVHWLPDGTAFALDGTGGGALVDAATGEVLERSEQGYGPFSPEGDAFLRRNEEAFRRRYETHFPMLEGPFELVERGTGRSRVESVLFPAKSQLEPIALCGSDLALYTANPTEGHSTGWDWSAGAYELTWFGGPARALKVTELSTGAFATLLPRTFGDEYFYSPRRIPALAARP